MEREYHNLHDYFTTKYPEDFDEYDIDLINFSKI